MPSKHRDIKACDKKIEGMRRIKNFCNMAEKKGSITKKEIHLPSDKFKCFTDSKVHDVSLTDAFTTIKRDLIILCN